MPRVRGEVGVQREKTRDVANYRRARNPSRASLIIIMMMMIIIIIIIIIIITEFRSCVKVEVAVLG